VSLAFQVPAGGRVGEWQTPAAPLPAEGSQMSQAAAAACASQGTLLALLRVGLPVEGRQQAA